MTHDTIFLDTQVLLLALQEQPPAGQESLAARARAFLNAAIKRKAVVMISSLSAMELFARSGCADHAELARHLGESFAVIPFDMAAAMAAASVCQERFNELQHSYPGGVAALVGDIEVLGSAISAGPARVLSNKPEFQALTRHYLNVEDIPELPPEHPNLF
ncbi:MAG: hypothetical protein A2X49_14120 [Lentisphaerae bacterium GWF2_52_8]|nr:MAG: hypothetical protein A2X49_14120 [Lentisphaerae bacterium GWF2_52_8]